MNEPISVGRTLRLRDSGYDEYWLQDRIFENPAILNLGELEAVARERQQSSGGKLDILLKNPEDNSMYEIEVMLGQTDESHIIRAIEYWDIEKHKWPQRQHYCALVAEVITRRFFNVIQLLSASIPIIAIQANIVEADGRKLLHFTKVLDVYEEREDTVSVQDGKYDEAHWKETAPWTVDTAYALLQLVKEVLPTASLGFVKNYISVSFGGGNRLWLRRRSAGETLVSVWLEEDDLEPAKKLLDQNGIEYDMQKNWLKFRLKKEAVTKHAAMVKDVMGILKDY